MYVLGSERNDFPPVQSATTEPNGLLAVGGDLHPERVLAGYRQGIFPWFSDDRLPIWWSPDPRMVLAPGEVQVSRSLRKRLRRRDYQVFTDRAFATVIDGCAQPRKATEGTWITARMRAAYLRLHQLGHAHSVETWINDAVVGGLYGVAIGRVFFGESMFSKVTDASKIAFVHLCGQLADWGFKLIDCQLHSDHLARLGGHLIGRSEFVADLATLCAEPTRWPTAGPRTLDWQPPPPAQQP